MNGGRAGRTAVGWAGIAVALPLATQLPTAGAATTSTAALCADAPAHPEWIFCDDFEAADPTVGPGRYFEIDDDDGDFVRRRGAGRDGSYGMRTAWQAGEVGAGGLKVAFGRNPNGYMNRSRIRPDDDFREIWVRLDVRHAPGWRGDPAKLMRATVFVHPTDWRQAMVAHLWGDGRNHLLVDPVRCVGPDDRVRCTTYNDFERFEWLGYRPGTTALFDTAQAGRWFCVVHHVRLNDPGAANGVQAFAIDGRPEARRDGLDFVRGYRDHALNAVFVENYWNDGSVQAQERAFDNFIVSAAPLDCPPPDDGAAATASATAAATVPAPSTATAPSPPLPSPTTTTPTGPPPATATTGARWRVRLPWAAR